MVMKSKSIGGKFPKEMPLVRFLDELTLAFPWVSEEDRHASFAKAVAELTREKGDKFTWQDVFDRIYAEFSQSSEVFSIDNAKDLWVQWADAFAAKWNLPEEARQQLMNRLESVSSLFSEFDKRLSKLETSTDLELWP